METTWISLALFVSVSVFKTADCTISGWASPSITAADGGSGTLTTKVDHGATSATLTITASTDGTVTAYSMTQSPTDVTFAISNAGSLTISSGTINYATTSVYTFVVTATDGDGSASATVTLSINDQPAFAATQYGYTIADSAAAGATLTTLTATDAVNSGSLSYSIDSGNTNTDFEITTAGAIKTLNAMSASTTGGYSLVLHAEDATLTGSTTVWVLVKSCSSGVAGIFASLITLLVSLMASLH